MENSSFTYSRYGNDYEIMSRIDNDIYYEIEILCEGVKDNLAQLKYMEVDVLINTYMHQCKFLAEHVLDYIHHERKTTLRLVKQKNESSRSVYRSVHLKELQMAQSNMKESFERFNEAVSFIYPGESFPDFLLTLRSKMMFVEIVMSDLFHLEKTKLIPQKVKLSNALKFESAVLN